MELSMLLFHLGITPNYKAYNQIITAISLTLKNADILLCMTKQLYPAIAQQHRTSWRAVERNIRLTSERAWRCNPVLLTQLAGHPLTAPPTTSQFIAILTAWQMKEQAD